MSDSPITRGDGVGSTSPRARGSQVDVGSFASSHVHEVVMGPR